jgi:hypothetical protein
MPVSYSNPYATQEDAKNGDPMAPQSDAIARRLLATRKTLSQGLPQSLPEFDSARNRTANQFQAKRTDTQNALQRRFAAMGNLNSGEAVKQLALANQGLADTENQAQQDINSQETQQINQTRDAEEQRALQQQALESDNDLKQQEFGLNKQVQQGQLDLAQKQFKRDSIDDAFNAAMAHAESSDQEAFARYLQSYMSMFSPFSGGAGQPAVPGGGAGTPIALNPGRQPITGVLPPPGPARPTGTQPSGSIGGSTVMLPGAQYPVNPNDYESMNLGNATYRRPIGSNGPWERVS